MSLTIAELERFAAGLAAAPERWQHLVRHDDSRVYEQIWDDGDVNAWLICWSEDSDTGFHDHDDSAAGITVVSGSVREDRLALNGPPRSRELSAGTTFTVPPTAIHRAYSPPLRRMGAYRVGADGELERESQPFEQELRAEPALA
jgi:mannose-6-phosphate isomerase-like protein (cupin superfamily)